MKLARIGILGFGREGKSVFKYLKKSSQFKKAKIEILDKKISVSYLQNLNRFDVIFRSPGIPYNLPELKRARRDGVYFSSVTKLFFENYKGKIIGITGTKGKGTTSTLLYKILKSAGKKVFLAGNIGKSAVDSLIKFGDYPLAVLELSSFQLQDLDSSPTIAVMLDVFPDHQDAHLNLREYYEAKANIGRFQKKNDKIFFFADNAMSRKLAAKSPAKKIPVDYRKFRSFGPEDLKIKGLHNFRNAVVAATVAESLGVGRVVIKKEAEKFKGLEHRLEFVKKLGRISFYNDSASTNPQTTVAAIEAFGKEPKVLIAGGYDKGLDYAPLSSSLKKHKETTVVLFGENKNKIRAAIKNSVEIKIVKDLKEAVRAACEISKARISRSQKIINCYVIFSPGAASFDRFRDYADRGEKFKKIVAAL